MHYKDKLITVIVHRVELNGAILFKDLQLSAQVCELVTISRSVLILLILTQRRTLSLPQISSDDLQPH